jgi:amino acid transporter
VFPNEASRLVSLLICISALGAVNGLIFTGARIFYAVGSDYQGLRFIGKWDKHAGTPVSALILQAWISVFIVFIAGTFKQTVVYTTTVVWLFFLATGISLFVLRRKYPDLERPYRTFGHPLTTIIFCLSCCYLVYSALIYDYRGSMISLGILICGIPVFYFLSRKKTVVEE